MDWLVHKMRLIGQHTQLLSPNFELVIDRSDPKQVMIVQQLLHIKLEVSEAFITKERSEYQSKSSRNQFTTQLHLAIHF